MDKELLPPAVPRLLNYLTGWLGAFLLFSITLSTLYAVIEEFIIIYNQGHVLLSDILLLFLYLEILAMVHQYATNGKLPVRYPIYIAMIAITRYIILGMKEMDGLSIVWLTLAIVLLAGATIVIRVGHHYWPYRSPGER